MKKQINIKIFLTILIFVASAVSQNLYYEGFGEAQDLEEAHKNALANLSESIQVSISSAFNRIITEENLSITEDYTKNQINSYSAISLRNVEFIENKQKKIWVVQARVFKYEVDKIFLERKSDIRSMISSAKHCEKNGQISDALKNFYWAYLLSYSIPDTVFTFFPNETIQGNARTILIPKIENLIRNIIFTVDKSYIEEGEFIVKLNVNYKDKPVNNLYISYYDGKYQDWVEVNDGLCYLTQSGDFSSDHIALNIIVEYQFEEEMDQFSSMRQINNGLKVPNIKNNISIELDLTDYIKYNFEPIKRDKDTFYFNPKLENISVSSIQWNFGDGKSSSIMNPIHTYSKQKNYVVSMTINNNDKLKVEKVIDILESTEPIITQPDPPDIPVEEPALKEPTIIKSSNTRSLPIISSLSEIKNLEELRVFLEKNHRYGNLIYGNSDDFENKNGLYTVILDNDNNETLGVMKFLDGKYINVKNDSSSVSLTDYFIGKKIAVIWLELFK
ncbi:PKD domain-containing protein [Candidatus Neomarinimicrobiota bacterium]